ncbi:MAG TPA: LysR family transcriptional regulator [Burkholderiales bacterium]|nr:LysR family transcriptional regulator [Burkholderiales bacterium]
MKASLKAGLESTKSLVVDEKRCIGFMGREGRVYATPMMVSDVEYACRDFLLGQLDPGEDSVGTQVVIDHLAATPLGMEVFIQVRISQVEKRKITFEFSVKDSIEEAGRGTHTRFVVDTAKTAERIAAKRARANLR